MIRKILVAIDNNDEAVRAVRVAARLAESLSASVCILHVISDAILSRAEQPTTELIQHMEDALVRLAMPHANLVRQRIMECGDPVQMILEQAQQLPADLIVVATRGLTEDGVSQGLLNAANCPVLVITPGTVVPPSTMRAPRAALA